MNELRRVRMTCPDGTPVSLKIVDVETGEEIRTCTKAAIVFDAEDNFSWAYLRLLDVNEDGSVTMFKRRTCGPILLHKAEWKTHVEKVLLDSLEIGQ
jgi:hypothetical protein